MTDFANGIGRHDAQTFYGWNGNLSTELESFFENEVKFRNFSQIVSRLVLQLDSLETANSLQIMERKFRYPDGKCYDININIDQYLKMGKAIDLTVWFNEDENTMVNIKITDPNREYFLSDIFTFSGNEIKKHLGAEHENTLDTYRVQIQEFNQMEEDEEAKCKPYKNSENESFRRCVQSFVEEKFAKEFGCVPPWFTDNVEDFCATSYSDQQ